MTISIANQSVEVILLGGKCSLHSLSLTPNQHALSSGEFEIMAMSELLRGGEAAAVQSRNCVVAAT